ncbi:hypothetical protein L1987_67855 [Smallanthus sonchifolius]|uniref:Uncharacterized protein n=1 Tax=Smallanthus sonchifolius TaxID=185202 RepID=A0ACB9B3F2_9ASTR|nr:hypothetical protein L1987_67855 [Smallanthus sonchifolius]
MNRPMVVMAKNDTPKPKSSYILQVQIDISEEIRTYQIGFPFGCLCKLSERRHHSRSSSSMFSLGPDLLRCHHNLGIRLLLSFYKDLNVVQFKYSLVYMDFEGRSDGRSIKPILSHVPLLKLILNPK